MDLIGIGLYRVKDVRFISLQYVVLLGMAAYGPAHWLRVEREARTAAASGETAA